MISADISREPILLDKDENLAAAVEALDKKKDTHVVVTDEGRIVGILSVKDILKVVLDRLRWGAQRVGKLYISSVMTSNPIYVDPETPLPQVIKTMLDKGISSVIVVDSLDNIDDVRIITKRDFLRRWRDLYPKKTLVGAIMTRDPIYVNPGTSIKHAEWLTRENKISTLPVVEEGVLVGYLDVRILALEISWAYFKGKIKHSRTFLEETTVEDVMKKPHYIAKSEDILDAADLLVQKSVKGSPVLDNDNPESRLVGVITETDLVKALLKEIK